MLIFSSNASRLDCRSSCSAVALGTCHADPRRAAVPFIEWSWRVLKRWVIWNRGFAIRFAGAAASAEPRILTAPSRLLRARGPRANVIIGIYALSQCDGSGLMWLIRRSLAGARGRPQGMDH